MNTRSALLAVIGVCALALLWACSSSHVVFEGDQDTPHVDADSDSDADTTPAPDGDSAEAEPISEREPESETDGDADAEAEFGREWVDGTEGFCRAAPFTVPDTGCTTASDCLGYFSAPDIDCGLASDGMNGAANECRFANAASFPKDPACPADELCKNTPRACVDGQCRANWPKAACAATSDCTLYDLGCACVAGARLGTAPDLKFAGSCPASGACETTMEPGCVRGYCAVVGSYMDAAIDYLCRNLVSQCLSGSASRPTEEQIASCIASFKEDHYARASLNWPLLRALQLAQTCNGLFSGPGATLLECIQSR